ncbi:hypothetical protein D3C81_1272450 [compost metagenome]
MRHAQRIDRGGQARIDGLLHGLHVRIKPQGGFRIGPVAYAQQFGIVMHHGGLDIIIGRCEQRCAIEPLALLVKTV